MILEQVCQIQNQRDPIYMVEKSQHDAHIRDTLKLSLAVQQNDLIYENGQFNIKMVELTAESSSDCNVDSMSKVVTSYLNLLNMSPR